MLFNDVLDKLRHYKIYRKMLVSYLFIVIVSVITICILLFVLFSESTTEEISNNSKLTLRQISYSADIVYEQVQNLSAQLINNQDVLNYLYIADPDQVIEYQAYLVINSLKASYPYLHSIGLYNGTSGTLLNPTGLSKEELIASQDKLYMNFTPRILNRTLTDESENLLTFVFYPNIMLLGPQSCAIIVNVNESYIRSLIQEMSMSSGSVTFVVDDSSRIISHPDSSKFMTYIDQENYIQEILAFDKSVHSFKTQVNGTKSLVTYSKSKRFEWYFVRVQPYKVLLENTYILRNITILSAFSLIILGLIFSFYMTRNLYTPIKSLLEKVQSKNNKHQDESMHYDEYELLTEAFTKSLQLENSMFRTINDSKKVLFDAFLVNILKGSPSEIKLPDNIIHEFNEKLVGPYYCVLIFKIDNFNNFKHISQENQSLTRFTITNIINEYLGQIFINDTFIVDENEIVTIVQYDSTKLKNKAYLAIKDIQSVIKKHFSQTISASIGDVTASVSDLQNSYYGAKDYIKYRIFYSAECIIEQKSIRNRLDKISNYPVTIEKRIIDAVQIRNDTTLEKGINDFIVYLSDLSYYQAINYANHLMLTLIKNFEQIANLVDDNMRDYYSVIAKITEAENLEDIKKTIHEICLNICWLVDKKSKQMTSQKYEFYINKAKEFINENYSNSYLSLGDVAEHVKLSTSYLGKLFKSITGISYNEFLNNIRLEKAVELLSETDYSEVIISEKVGFNNISYFSTLFKKNYRIPPSLFREREALKKFKKSLK